MKKLASDFSSVPANYITEIFVVGYLVSGTHFTAKIGSANVSLGMKFASESTEIKVRTPSEEWKTRVPYPGPFLTHVTITWDEKSHLRYYENGSLLAEDASVLLLRKENNHTSLSTYPEYVWLNELKLWNSALTEPSAITQHRTSKF